MKIQNHNSGVQPVNLLEHAHRYADKGFSIIPAKGKKSVGPWKGFQTKAANYAALERMFANQDVTGLAVILGPVSGGLVCRDFDLQDAYDAWALAHADLAKFLPTVATARGRHVYFRGPAFFEDLADGEYRGTQRQYTLLPPSVHPTGQIYHWLTPLPNGELPLVDPFKAGLCNRVDKEDTLGRENKGDRGDADNPAINSQLVLTAPTLLQDIEQAIVATLPTMQGQRGRCIFNFVRHLKALPDLVNADPAKLRPIIQKWHRRALPVIGTKPFVESWADFLHSWKTAKIPAGNGPLDAAFRSALSNTTPTQAMDLYGPGPIALLAAFCRDLQSLVGNCEFFLDCRTAGRLIGVEHTTAWRYLDVLCADGILAAGAKGSKATRKASRFRFIDQQT